MKGANGKRRQRKEAARRTKRVFPQVVKRLFHPELEDGLECSSRLERACPISPRTGITLSQVLAGTHCGYRCPEASCPGRPRLYRSTPADALAWPGFTFGLEVVRWVGQLRPGQHQTVDAHPSNARATAGFLASLASLAGRGCFFLRPPGP